MIRTAFEGEGRAGVVSAAAAAASASAGASNAKGSYTQLVASTTVPTSEIVILLGQIGIAARYLCDWAVGAGGSEQIVLPNQLFEINASFTVGSTPLRFPIHLPTGTRIAARGQNTTSLTRNFQFQSLLVYRGAAEDPVGQITTYGVSTATTIGTAIDPGPVGGSFGAYAQVDAAIAQRVRQLIVQFHNQLVNHPAGWHEVQIAIGAGGSEQIVHDASYLNNWDVTGAMVVNGVGTLNFPIQIPSGTRIACRAASSDTASGTRSIDVSMHGVS